jgi:putative zinc finger protein
MRRLPEFHDEELPVADQIAVGAHLEWCSKCAAAFEELGRVRAAIRRGAGHSTLTEDEGDTLQAAVVSRVRAERTASFFVRVRAMFEDMHFVYAGAGAAVAALFCVLSLSTMLNVASLASPGSNENPFLLSGRVLAPVALNGSFATLIDPADTSESVFMIRAVVTREGTVEHPELVHATSDQQPITPGTEQARAAETLMGAVSRARFEPARVDGLPVAVNMVWMVANTTVRADKPLTARRGSSRKPVAWWRAAGARASEV